jgi:hypothetical protein
MAERLAASSPDGDGTVLAEVEVGTAVGGCRGAEGTREDGARAVRQALRTPGRTRFRPGHRLRWSAGGPSGTTAHVGPGGAPTTGAPR